jgi:hypothetical protein
MPFVQDDPGSGDPVGHAMSGLYATDLEILAAGSTGTGVVSGCALSLVSGLLVAVASGVVKVAGATIVSGANTVVATNHATLPRWGLVTTNGTPIITMGTPDADPDLPAIPAGHAVLGVVYISAGLTTLTAAHINGLKRVVVPSNVVAMARIAADITTTLATAQTATGLSFPIAANEVYQFAAELFIACSSTGGLKFAIDIPTSATIKASVLGESSGPTAFLEQFITADATLIATAINTFAGSSRVRIEGIVANGANAGTVQVQYAAGTAGQTATIQANSHVARTRIA